jgi:hypothetical protein
MGDPGAHSPCPAREPRRTAPQLVALAAGRDSTRGPFRPDRRAPGPGRSIARPIEGDKFGSRRVNPPFAGTDARDVVVFAAVIFSQIKKKVRSGDRAGAVALARRWRRFHPRSASACYFEYWALIGDRERQPGEHIDLLRRAFNLKPYQASTSTNQLVSELIRMYAKWGREQYAAEAERVMDHIHEVWGESPWELLCRADLALLRGDRDAERGLRERAWEIQPRKDHPGAILPRALEHVDDGDRGAAKALLMQAAADKRADWLTHAYLSVLVENEDPQMAATHRAETQRLYRDSPELLEKELDNFRMRVNEGPFARLKA